MASVRMSEQLRSNIRKAAITAFDIADPIPKPSTEFQQKLREAVTKLPSQIALKKILDEDLITDHSLSAQSFKPKQLSCSKFNIKEKPSTENDKSYAYLVELDVPLTILLNQSHRWSGFSVDLYLEELKPEYRYKVTERFNKFVDALNERNQRERKYINSIEALLKRCTTLKQALAAWPALESFVPPEVMQTLHTKVTRVQKARQTKEEIHFDDALANQIVLTSKLMG